MGQTANFFSELILNSAHCQVIKSANKLKKQFKARGGNTVGGDCNKAARSFGSPKLLAAVD